MCTMRGSAPPRCSKRSAETRAKELREKAADLFERFNAKFWDDDFGFYAYALDGDKKKVLTVASDAGQ